MFVDSHCHLHLIDYQALNTDLNSVVQEAIQGGVEHMLCVGTDLKDVSTILRIAEDHATVSGSVGLHPNEVVEEEPTIEQLVSLAEHPKVIAIGETGLDYYRTKEAEDWQIERFIKHIEVAKKTRKPLIIHTRQAKEDTLAILKAEKAGEIGGVLHCFTEDWETAKSALDLGFYISFSGIVTFKNAEVLQSVAAKVPLDRLLIETDAPYLTPHPYRGKINQPAYVKYVAECIAGLKDMDLSVIAHHTTQNFYRLFL